MIAVLLWPFIVQNGCGSLIAPLIQANRSVDMKTKALLSLAFAGVLSSPVWISDGRAASAEILESYIVEDEFGSAGWLGLQLQLPVEHFVRIEGTTNLTHWSAATDPVLSWNTQLELNVPMEADFPERFFRVSSWPAPVAFAKEGGLYRLDVTGPIATHDLLGYLARKTGSDLFLTDSEDMDDPIQPGVFRGGDLETLLGQVGVRTWTPAFEKDDPSLADLFPNEPRDQKGLLPDTNPGKGEIDDGWNGDNIREIPNEGPPDPEPNPNADMKLVIDIPTLPPGTPPDPPNRPEPGKHLRVALEFFSNGQVNPLTAFEVEGGATLPEPFPLPDLGSTIWVVRSPIGAPNEPGNILYIGTGPDPLTERSYDPPFRGSHGSGQAPSGVLRLPVPVPDKEGTPILDDLTLEVFRYSEFADIDVLTPTTFLRNENSFKRISVLYDTNIVQLLEDSKTNHTHLRAQFGHTTSTLTQLHYSGPRSKKFNFVIVGDGFRNTAADQNAFNNYVSNVVMNQLFSQDIHPEIMNAMNVFRINTISADSGVTQVDGSGNVTTARNTALMFRYSGVWNRCWMELTPFSLFPLEFGSELRLALVLNEHVPEADMVAVVLNETSGGGCARGSHFAVTLGSGWGTFAHEFGHNPGGLGDEYQCNQGAAGCGSYTGGQPGAPNLDNTTSRANVKWSSWIPSWRPVPTAQANIADNQQDVGIFAGATIGSGQWWTGIYRPSWRGRMNNNTPVNNPVGYTRVRDNFRPRQEGDFRKTAVGDFNGDGRDDVVMIDDRQISLHLADDRNVGANDPVKGSPPRSVTGVLEPTWFNTGPLWNAGKSWLWITRKSDILLPADFNNDGMDDLYVINLVDWAQPYVCMLRSFGDRFEPVYIYATSLPGWTMTSGDEFYTGDIDDDGRMDLMVFNGKNWIMPYFLLNRSTGSSLQYVRRYDQFLPVWEMGRNEKFLIGDFNDDDRDDLAVIDTASWAQVHLRTYASVPGGLSLRDRFYGTITTAGGGNFWQMRRKDVLHALDFDNDRMTDLAIFNGFDWGPVYLGMMRVVNGDIIPQKRYDNSVNHLPGWQMQRSDRFKSADVNGDGRDDLSVYNAVNWSTQYLGILRSTGGGNLQGTWQDDWIGGWNLGSGDGFHVSDFRGGAGWDDLFVFNKDWFGLLRSHSNHYKLEAIYPKWFHNHRYHPNGLW